MSRAVKKPARIGVLSAVLLFAGQVEASPIDSGAHFPGLARGRVAVVPGFSVRNGDWVAVDGLGVALLRSSVTDRSLAIVARGELGIGGAAAGLGVATSATSARCSRPAACDMSDFLGSGILSLEARVERMYGPTGWRPATYLGGQVSLAGIVFKPSVAWMVDLHGRRDNHWQIGFAGAGW